MVGSYGLTGSVPPKVMDILKSKLESGKTGLWPQESRVRNLAYVQFEQITMALAYSPTTSRRRRGRKT